MSRIRKHANSSSVAPGGMPWIVPGLFIGMLAGAAAEVVYGISMLRMMAGSFAGLMVGALADFLRSRWRARPKAANPGQKRRG